MSKSILIVYPHNLTEPICGADTRFRELVGYFRGRDYAVDQLGLDHFEKGVSWDLDKIKRENLLRNVFVFDQREEANPLVPSKPAVKVKKSKVKRSVYQRVSYRLQQGLVKGMYTFIKGRYDNFIIQSYAARMRSLPQKPAAEPKKDAPRRLPDMAGHLIQARFDDIVGKGNYDYILISYVYWANLIKDKTYPNTKTVIAIEDFVTLQFLYAQQTKSNFGVMLEEEIARINQFDVAICISSDEKYFFSQFAARPKFYFVPQYFPNRAIRASGNFTYDLLFIGSANPHNQKSIAWFFSHVYPALSPDYRILLVGKISDYADDRPNVTKIRFADDLDEIYRQVKVAICPMLQGTGMKIKVVEALSYGKPVVCTIKGVDGFPQKHDNGCLIADEPEAFAALVSRLLEEEAFYTAHQRRAIAYFAGTFEQSKVFSTLDEIFSHP